VAASDGGIPFGSYALLKRLARGGMAEVFLAKQRYLDGYDRRVAVKRILPHLSDSADFVRMFLGEARLAARLTHPNIVHIYDFGKISDEYYIAMEYVDGVHCGQLIKHAATEPLPPTLVARIGADAAAALHYAHQFSDGDGKSLRLVHRDVSPPNLMVSFDGVVKLVDFGIAKATNVEALTNPGTVKGKYAYMSPEQTTARTLDGRSDVFSLGLVLWELVAGRHIVERGNPVDAMRAIRDGKLPAIETVVPRVPRELARALDLALQTDREDRASALELSQILEAYLKAAPDLATSMQLATWIRGRFSPSAAGMVPALPAGPGTKVATAASSDAHSIVTPDAGDQTQATLAPAPPGDDDLRDTMLDGGTLGGGSSTLSGDVGVATVRTTNERRAPTSERERERGRPRGTTRPPPVPAASRRTPPPPSRARASEDAASDLDDNETIERSHRMAGALDASSGGSGSAVAGRGPTGPSIVLMRPEDRPTDLGADGRATLIGDPDVIGATTVIPSPPVAAGTQTSQPALPIVDADADADRMDRMDPTNVDRTLRRGEPPVRESTRRRALLAAIAGGISAAVVGVVVVFVLARGCGSTPATTPDAAPAVVRVAPVDAPPVTTELRVVTQPPGAVVSIGDRRGQTPITFALEPGTFTVRIAHTGFVAVDRKVELAKGDHRILDLTLEPTPVVVAPTPDAAPPVMEKDKPDKRGKRPATGLLTVTTTPYSNVYLGKKLLGQTPFAEVEVAAGTHTLTFKHPKRRTTTRKVTITPGKTAKLKFALP
jgi:serine/threonine protein kinase